MEESNKEKDSLARSQSWAIIRHIERQGASRKQSDPFVEDEPDLSPSGDTVPIQHAQSYKPAASSADKTIEMAGVRRLMDTLSEQQHMNTSTHSRQSAASLKVHFRSVDDISNEDDDEESDGGIETSFDSRRRSQSGMPNFDLRCAHTCVTEVAFIARLITFLCAVMNSRAGGTQRGVRTDLLVLVRSAGCHY